MSHETHCDTYPGSNGQLANRPDEVSVDGKVGKNSSGDYRHCRLDERMGWLSEPGFWQFLGVCDQE